MYKGGSERYFRTGSSIEGDASRALGESQKSKEETIKDLSKGALSILKSDEPKHLEFVGAVSRLLKERGSPEEIPQYEQDEASKVFIFQPEMVIALAQEINKATQRYQ